MPHLLNPYAIAPAAAAVAAGFAAVTTVTDRGSAFFPTIHLTRRTGVDELTTTITLPFSVTYFGVSYSTIRVNSNSYMTFGTTTPASLPSFSYVPTGANGPSIGVIAHPSSITDGNVQFIASLTSGTTFTLRYEGGYP